MFFDFGAGEVIGLAILAMILIGPERLPSFAVDAASRLGTQDVTIAVRRRDVIASIERLVNMASIRVRLAYLS